MSGPQKRRAQEPSRFRSPYIQIGLTALLTCLAELLLKKGAVSAEHVGWVPEWSGVSAMTSVWTWAGIAAYLGSFASWLYVLRRVPLNIAYSLVNVAQFLVPLGASIFLHERVSQWRWAGIALVLGGIYLLINVAAELEKQS